MNDKDRAERAAGKTVCGDGTNLIAYQGEEGANSHVACLERFPNMQPVPCATFEDALQAVKSGHATYAMIPIENTLAGRVADVHHLLPHAGLYIVGATLHIGDVVLKITDETAPCARMDEAAAGLRRALTPDWRGGVCCQVVRGGQVSTSTEVAVQIPQDA